MDHGLIYDRAHSTNQQVDPESKRTIGVVTKMHLVEKDMMIVEKLQMTSNKDVVLPLGYIIAILHLNNTMPSCV